jgi:hypothetical protein
MHEIIVRGEAARQRIVKEATFSGETHAAAPSWTAANPFARCRMRSSLIFEVSPRFANRYQLCRMLATSARKMHRDGASTAQSINQSLRALHDAPPGTLPGAAPLPPESVPTELMAGEEAAARLR